MRKTAVALCTLCLSLALVAATPPAPAPPAKDSAQAVITAFYTLTMTMGPHGVPDQKDLPEFKPLLTERLYKLLCDASSAEVVYGKKTKHEVPPLVEGDLFSSLAEGPTAFQPETCDLKGPEGACFVALTYADPDGRNKTQWKDRLYLVKGPSGWRIDDLEYLAPRQFGNKGRLQRLLQDVIKEAAEYLDR